jgi:hypothetical protein
MAKVGGVPIWSKQVLAETKRNGWTPRVALERLVEQQLAAEAIRGLGRGLPPPDDPEVKSALVGRLLERELEPSLDDASAIPDSTLRPLYEKARDNFVHPRLVEVGVLVIYTGNLMKDEPRKARAATARELYAFVTAHRPATLDDFAAIASDSQWSERNVGFNRLWQSLDKPYSITVGTEVAKLRAQGDTTPLISDETGFFIARYISERPAENLSFERARPQIASAYFERWRREQFLAFSGRLLHAHKVEAHFDRITPDEQGR